MGVVQNQKYLKAHCNKIGFSAAAAACSSVSGVRSITKQATRRCFFMGVGGPIRGKDLTCKKEVGNRRGPGPRVGTAPSGVESDVKCKSAGPLCGCHQAVKGQVCYKAPGYY